VGIVIIPEEVRLKLEGWVSNSRIASHAVPRWSSLSITSDKNPTTSPDVINVADESQRCRERLSILEWGKDKRGVDSRSTVKSTEPATLITAPGAGSAIVSLSPVSLGPGDILHLRLRVDHQHVFYGDYDPLLGIRTLELTVGHFVIRDVLSLDREQYLAQPECTWLKPPDDRLDTRYFVSAPDSLHLEAHVQSHRSYRYQEQPVRYNTGMRLVFWYLIAEATEGECWVHVGQNKDTPLAWRQLHDASFDERLKTVGRWTKYERVFQTAAEATRLILEFKIVGETDVGEMWIDDVSLKPMQPMGPGGP
jgi:hypothetical protein